MAALHISFSAEPVIHIGEFVVTNSMLTSIVVSILLILFALRVRSSLKSSGKHGRLQTFAEFIVESLNNLVLSVAGPGKKAILFAPLIMTFFLFILMNNWIGLLPGVGTIGFMEEHVFVPYFRAGTADLNMTLALALISMTLVQFFGIKYQHFKYFSKFINFSNPINFFVGILELISELAKIISFTFRLFGNIFAGEVLLAVIGFLIPVIVPMPFYGLELFVGFIQALVFSMLSLVFFNMATMGHGEEHE